MAELEDRLGAILNDPEQMARIAKMASQLMGSIAPESAAPAAPAASSAPSGDAALMGMVGRIMGSLRGGGERQQLLRGLSPYLAAERRRRLEKALGLAAAAKVAGAAWTELGGQKDESV